MPSISKSQIERALDTWAQHLQQRAAAVDALGVQELTPDALRQTAGFILKNSEDLAAVENLDQSHSHECNCGGHCGGHHHG